MSRRIAKHVLVQAHNPKTEEKVRAIYANDTAKAIEAENAFLEAFGKNYARAFEALDDQHVIALFRALEDGASKADAAKFRAHPLRPANTDAPVTVPAPRTASED